MGASQPRGTAKLTGAGSDIQSSGANYGSGQASRFKQTKAYRQAIASVFAHQPTKQKAAILAGLMRSNAFNTPEGKAIKSVWSGLSFDEKVALHDLLPHSPGFGEQALHAIESLYQGQKSLSSPFGGTSAAALTQGQRRVISAVRQVPGAKSALQELGSLAAGKTGDLRSPFGGSGTAAIGQAGGNLAAGIQRLPLPKPIDQETQLAGIGTPPQQVAKNVLKDLVNLPAEVGPSIAIPAAEAASGHWSQAAHTVIDPYVHAFEHPGQAFSEHPLNTALMAGGLAHPAARTVETVGRAALGKGRVNLIPESIHLGSGLTHERPNWSKSPITRLSQKSIAKQLYERAPNGQLIPKHETVHARLTKIETSRLVGQNERVRRAGHVEEMSAHTNAVLRKRVARGAHAVKTALKYDPKPALVHGADVLALIAQGVLRRPDTVVQDLTKHIAEVSALRHELLDFPASLTEHDAYVKELTQARDAAAKNKNLRSDIAPAFKAAMRYAKEYASHERAAHALGHFRDMSREALQRRTLMAPVKSHMPGARFDPELGMVIDTPLKGGSIHTRKLTTQEMAAFVKRETGGRPVAFVSHEPRRGDSAHYVNSQRRPYPAAMGNTLFNFRHGLTNPSHEAMLEQRVRMRGIVDSHRAVNRLDQQLVSLPNKGEGWNNYKDAERDLRGTGMQPIRLAQQFHPPASLKQALDNVNMGTLEEEATRRSLDINARLAPSSEPGKYGAIDQHAAAQLQAHEKLISPNSFLRGLRGMTNQFRTVALGTSFRHLPGVAQEELIRAAMEGIGPISWLAGRATIARMRKIDPVLGRQRHIELTGGTVTGQALSLGTRQVSRHFTGTLLEPALRVFEKTLRAPVLRQANGMWHAWTKFTLGGTKKFLEENSQIAGVGKQVIADFGGNHGLLAGALGTWGKMIDQAAHGVLDEATARRMGSYVRRVYGRWTDLTPGEQGALMFSPFGMWWTNSVAWLMRMPIDHPVGSAFFAALNTGTEKERQKLGLDMFSPNHLPLYKQGGIPVGGQLWGANYYSPVGVANDPGETMQSLIAPWQAELLKGLAGKDWKGDTITSPGNPGGRGKASAVDVATVILNSLAGSFIPLYQKAQTIVQGGAPSYATSTLLNPKTKGPNPGLLQGVKKAVMPIRLGALAAPGGHRGTSSNPLSTFGAPSNVTGGGGNVDHILKAFGG